MAKDAAALQKQTTGQANQSFSNAQQSFRGALGGYQSLYSNPGYTPSQQSALTSGTLAPIGAAGGSAIRSLYDTAARTGNSAGVTGGADAVARSRMQALGQGGNQVATQIADASRSDQKTALAGEASLYAPSLSSASSLYDTAQKASASRPGFLDYLTGISSALTGGSGAYKTIKDA